MSLQKLFGSEFKLLFRRPQLQLQHRAFFIYQILTEVIVIELAHSHYTVLKSSFKFIMTDLKFVIAVYYKLLSLTYHKRITLTHK